MLLQLLGEMLTVIGGLIIAYVIYALVAKRDDRPSTDPPTMAHTALREIVERAVEEARKLPGLGSAGEVERAQEGRNIVEHSYEDLLATAILNKVIEKFQREQIDGNSNVLHGKPVSRTKCTLSESELGLDEGVEEGCSSLEPLSQDECSDCSASCLRHARNPAESLSLTIEERIEEVTTTYGSDEDHRENDILVIGNSYRVPFPEFGMDIIDPSQDSEDSQDEPETPTAHVDVISPLESWEENWLFQKKRVPTQADPVAMLVPNSSADFKALIGDKDAEDTSDLSECSSAQSDEEIEKELIEAINNVVPRSPTKTEPNVINGINDFPAMERLSDEVVGKSAENVAKMSGVVDKCEAEGKLGIEREQQSAQIVDENKIKEDEERKVEKEVTEDFEKNLETGVEFVQCSRIANREKETKEVEAEANCEIKTAGMRNKNENVTEKLIEGETCVSESRNILNNNKGTLGAPEEFSAIASETGADPVDFKTAPKIGEFKEETIVEDNSGDKSGPVSLSAESVPKTPTCTPTRASMTENAGENANNAENCIDRDERVLNSLECAKQKLMVVDDDCPESMQQEETMADVKVEFNPEDAQQDSEYTEHYDIATQRHLDSLTKTDTLPSEAEVNAEDKKQEFETSEELGGEDASKCREAVAFAKAKSASNLSQQNGKTEEEVQLTSPPRPGTIAEREHKKWENAAPIENNPYSEESIQRRLWERQYSRRLSDIPGIHAELPKSNGADLEVVLRPQEPDMKRFGRDYYINNAKAASGDRCRKSVASTSSRPSSSLSQRSSSTGADQEQQVSFELDKFEEASLHGSLSRWNYLDPHSSPHFAINPLLRLKLAEELTPGANDGNETVRIPERSRWEGKTSSEDFGSGEVESTSLSEEKIQNEEMGDGTFGMIRPKLNGKLNLRIDDEGFKRKNLSFGLDDSAGDVAFNPLYEAEQELVLSPVTSTPDQDSGMYSTDSNDLEGLKDKGPVEDQWQRLRWPAEWQGNGKESQILSANGRRYWNTGGFKYHTFGGIRHCGVDEYTKDDSDEENLKLETVGEPLSLDGTDFSNLKFQTFGGIKGNGALRAYRRVKLRPSLQLFKNTKSGGCQAKNGNRFFEESGIGYPEEDPILQENPEDRRTCDENSELSFGEDSWQDEDDNIVSCTRKKPSRSSSKFSTNSASRHNKSYKKHLKAVSSSSSQSSRDWQDEDTTADDLIMTKFLKDAARRPKSRLSTDNDSSYALNTSRKMIPAHCNAKRVKCQRKRSSPDNESLKLEPPIVPEVVERTFDTLRDLRSSDKNKKKRKSLPSGKKPRVWSLSDVTIW